MQARREIALDNRERDCQLHRNGVLWCMAQAKHPAKRTQPKGAASKADRVSVSFTPEQYEFLSQLADRKHVSIAWVVRAAVDKLISEQTPLFTESPL